MADGARSLRILVFTEGTLLFHGSWRGLPREEIVARVRRGRDPGARDFAGHVPIGHAAGKVRSWTRAGATILYLTSRRTPEEIRAVRRVLAAHGFPDGDLLFRREGETYADVAMRARPDVIVEDDCESIGGEVEMAHPHLPDGPRSRIRSVVVREFGGIDHLPDDPRELCAA